MKIEQLEGRLVGLDTMIFVYQFQAHPRYAPVTSRIFKGLEQGRLRGVASAISLQELLVRPYRLGRPDLAAAYRRLLTNLPALSFEALDAEIADAAARLQADQRLKAGDATVVATAIQAGADVLVSNDRRLKRRGTLPLLLLDDVVRSGTG